MKTYGEWSPTPFDPKGSHLPDKADWLVVPVMRTRDSGPLDESNFEAALKELGGESKKVEVHRFGHWGPGWIEIIIVHPSKREKAEEIEASLENYPVLDEDDLNKKEWEDFVSSWDDWGAKELRDLITAWAEIKDSDDESLFEDAADDEMLREWWMDFAGHPYESESSGVSIDFKQFDRISAKAKDALVREIKIKAGLERRPAKSEVGEPLLKYAGLNPKRRRGGRRR